MINEELTIISGIDESLLEVIEELPIVEITSDNSLIQISEEDSPLEIVNNISNSSLELIDNSDSIEVIELSTSITSHLPLVETIEIVERGLPGLIGLTGASAYQSAVREGFSGSISDWLLSLKGIKGDRGSVGTQGIPGLNGTGSPLSETLIITSAIETSFNLMYIPQSNSLVGFLNGIRERSSSFSIVNSIVNFNTLELAQGDEVTFDYKIW